MKQLLKFGYILLFAAAIGFLSHVVHVKNAADKLRAKSNHVQSGMLAWLDKNKNPKEAGALFNDAIAALKEQNFTAADKLLDKALAVLGEEGKTTPEDYPAEEEKAEYTDLYIHPHPVEITGYEGQAMDPFPSPDGKFLFFNNPAGETKDMNLHVAERTGTEQFRYIGPLEGANSDAMDAAASLDKSGHFYFISRRDAAKGSVYAADFKGQGVVNVRLAAGLALPVPGVSYMDVSIAPDGKTLYLSRTGFALDRGEPRLSDIVMARLEGGKFRIDPDSAATLENINTNFLEYAPAVSADGKELYFTRASRDGASLMVASRRSLNGPFGAPKILKSINGVAESPALSVDKKELFFHRSDRGGYSIYRAERNPEATP